MNLRETYDKIAQDWHQDHAADDWWISGAEKFAMLLPRGAVILDAGCAGGTKSKFFSSKGFRVLGIDFAPNFIEIAKKEVPEVEFQVLDIRDIASLPQEFDGIFLQAVLLHFPKKEIPQILENILTKLKPGGYIHIAVKEAKENKPEEEVVTEDDYGYAYKRFFSYFTQSELVAILERLGLTVVSSETSHRWVQVLAKK